MRTLEYRKLTYQEVHMRPHPEDSGKNYYFTTTNLTPGASKVANTNTQKERAVTSDFIHSKELLSFKDNQE